MSWHYLQGLEAASWEGTCLDGAPAALLSLTPTPAPCCLHDNATDACRDSQSGTTCGRSMGDLGEDPSTSSQVDSHAKTSVQPEREKGSLASVPDSGGKWRESWVKYDLTTHGWKTHQCLWDEALPWSSVTLPKWGMMRGGELWERTTPSGLTALRAWITNALDCGFSRMPTPTVCGNYNRKGASATSGDGLATAVRRVPTPTACMFKGSSPAALTRKDGQSRENDRLDHSVMASDGGQLNPTWTEWLMGWPLLWTSMEPMPLETWRAWESAFRSEPIACAASATGRSLPLSSSLGQS